MMAGMSEMAKRGLERYYAAKKKGKKPVKTKRVGGGARFGALVKKLAARGDVKDPEALAAAIGRKKYGA